MDVGFLKRVFSYSHVLITRPQVQFRLKQIVDASPEEKEILLLQLEEFANRGIPDLRDLSVCKKSTVSEHVSLLLI